MQIRDTVKDLAYFEKEIDECQRAIVRGRELLAEGKAKRPEFVESTIGDDLLDTAICQYSAGYALDDVAESVVDAIDQYHSASHFHAGRAFPNYLRMVSMSICLDLNDEAIQKLAAIGERSDLKDRLVETLLSTRLESPEDFSDWPVMAFYQDLASVLDTLSSHPDEVVVLLDHYLSQQWYNNHKELGWHGIHKKETGYCGYWSFETAALVRIFNLDDDALKDHLYYPYDLAHATTNPAQ